MTKETTLTIASVLLSIGVVGVGVVLTSSTAFGQGNTTTPGGMTQNIFHKFKAVQVMNRPTLQNCGRQINLKM